MYSVSPTPPTGRTRLWWIGTILSSLWSLLMLAFSIGLDLQTGGCCPVSWFDQVIVGFVGLTVARIVLVSWDQQPGVRARLYRLLDSACWGLGVATFGIAMFSIIAVYILDAA